MLKGKSLLYVGEENVSQEFSLKNIDETRN